MYIHRRHGEWGSLRAYRKEGLAVYLLGMRKVVARRATSSMNLDEFSKK